MKGFNWVLNIGTYTQVTANRLVTAMESALHIISFVCRKMLQPVWPLVNCWQGKFAELHFGFKKVEEIIHMYERNVWEAWVAIPVSIH